LNELVSVESTFFSWSLLEHRPNTFDHLASMMTFHNHANSRRDYSSCFGGSSYQTEMAITATLRFTGLPVR
jgi:hypothetical protein